MEVVSNKVIFTASPDEVWERLVDWNTWPRWDKGMESISFEGPIAPGSVGKLKLKDGPQLDLRIVDMETGKYYSSAFDFLGCQFTFHHRVRQLAEDPGTVEVTFSVDADGPTELLVGNFMKLAIKDKLPEWMNNFRHQFAVAL